jgi:branched-chain amino acid transport system substrate-binding protein
VRIPPLYLAFLLLSLLITLAACQAPSAGVTLPPVLPVPAAVEVTRVVTQTVVVTPQPSLCNRWPLQTVDEVRVGALLSLSKSSAMLSGFAMQASLNLAVEEINTAGGIDGKPLQLIVYDDAGLPERGVEMAQRLIQEDCVAALIGPYYNEVAAPVVEVAHAAGIPLILTESNADELTATQYPEIFRVGAPAGMWAQSTAQWLAAVGDHNGDGEQYVLMLAENNPWTATKVEKLQPWLTKLQINSTTLSVELPADDFSALIARVAALEMLPDVVLLYVSGESGLNLQEELLKAGIGPKKKSILVIGPAGLNDTLFWPRVPDGEYTVIAKNGPWVTTVTPTATRFVDAYTRIFDQWPEAYAFETYDALYLIADAVRRAQSLEPAAMIRALETTDIVLASGHYTFPYGSLNPPDGDHAPLYLWHQWLEPHTLFLQYVTPQQPAKDAAVVWPLTYRTVLSSLLYPR